MPRPISPRNLQIICLARDGLSSRQIANKLSLDCQLISITLSKARRSGYLFATEFPTPRTPRDSVRVKIPKSTYNAFAKEARLRNTTAAKLIRSILLTTAKDDLFNAILN